MAREHTTVTVKLYSDDEKDKKIQEFLKDKPNTFIFKEALELYMDSYNAMKEGKAQANTKSNAKSFF
jgi:hypothetical protein